jgi:hypothetical protein
MSGADLELDERLRRLAPAYKDGIEPPATLHVRVMAIAAPPQRPVRRSILRELSLAAALVAFVAALAFGFSRLHSVTPGPVKRSPSPSPAAGVIPWISATPLPSKLQPPKILTADQAAQDVRQTVNGVHPVLLPSSIPPGFQAELYDDSGSFTVNYRAADGRKILFGIAVVDPGIGDPNVIRQSYPTFRGVRANIYQVTDARVATSNRWLSWTEPGSAPSLPAGVPYIMTTDGFTETEFWRLANSIGPIPAPTAIRRCAVDDLFAVSNGGNGATGHIVYSVALANHSATACTLQGFPGLVLITKQGTAVPLQESNDPGGMVGNGGRDIPTGVLEPDQLAPVPHQSGPFAYVLFEWYYCGGTPPEIAAVDLTPPGSTRWVRVPLLNEGQAAGPSRCDDLSQGRRLLVGPIQAPRADQVVTPIRQWQVVMDAPAPFVRGKTVAFTVTLTNISGVPVVFDTCPTYEEGFTPDQMVAYQLNCAPVGTVQPGASVTFAMRFMVPLTTPAGPQKFRWALRGTDLSASTGRLVTVSGS